MDTFIVVTTVSALVIGGIGSWAGVRAVRQVARDSHRKRQEQLRTDLRRWVNKQFRLARAVNGLDRGLPGDHVEADLEEFRDYLAVRKHSFDAPTPAQLGSVIKSIDDALVKLAVAQHVPRNDTVFIPHVDQIKCNVLRPWLERALDNVNILLDGLAQVERQPMSLRKQIKVFEALNPGNQTPIEE